MPKKLQVGVHGYSANLQVVIYLLADLMTCLFGLHHPIYKFPRVHFNRDFHQFQHSTRNMF